MSVYYIIFFIHFTVSAKQGITERCRLSWLTNSTLVYEPIAQVLGVGGSCGVSANEYSCAHGAQKNFGDLTPYLTYGGNLKDDFTC